MRPAFKPFKNILEKLQIFENEFGATIVEQMDTYLLSLNMLLTDFMEMEKRQTKNPQDPKLGEVFDDYEEAKEEVRKDWEQTVSVYQDFKDELMEVKSSINFGNYINGIILDK